MEQLALREAASPTLEAMLAELDDLAIRYAEVEAECGNTIRIEERMWELEDLIAS